MIDVPVAFLTTLFGNQEVDMTEEDDTVTFVFKKRVLLDNEYVELKTEPIIVGLNNKLKKYDVKVKNPYYKPGKNYQYYCLTKEELENGTFDFGIGCIIDDREF